MRQVEDLLHERGIDVCYETIRAWWNRFAPNGDGILMKFSSRSMEDLTISGGPSTTKEKFWKSMLQRDENEQ